MRIVVTHTNDRPNNNNNNNNSTLQCENWPAVAAFICMKTCPSNEMHLALRRSPTPLIISCRIVAVTADCRLSKRNNKYGHVIRSHAVCFSSADVQSRPHPNRPWTLEVKRIMRQKTNRFVLFLLTVWCAHCTDSSAAGIYHLYLPWWFKR